MAKTSTLGQPLLPLLADDMAPAIRRAAHVALGLLGGWADHAEPAFDQADEPADHVAHLLALILAHEGALNADVAGRAAQMSPKMALAVQRLLAGCALSCLG